MAKSSKSNLSPYQQKLFNEWVADQDEQDEIESQIPKPTYIYESPDGGRTVFKREAGSLQRTQIMGPDVECIDDDFQGWLDDRQQYEIDYGEHYEGVGGAVREWTWWDDNAEWSDMKKVAKDHPALQAAIDHAIMIYKLSKEENNNDEDLPF